MYKRQEQRDNNYLCLLDSNDRGPKRHRPTSRGVLCCMCLVSVEELHRVSHRNLGIRKANDTNVTLVTQ